MCVVRACMRAVYSCTKCIIILLYFTVSTHKKGDTAQGTSEKSPGSVVATSAPSTAVLKVAENIKVSSFIVHCLHAF